MTLRAAPLALAALLVTPIVSAATVDGFLEAPYVLVDAATALSSDEGLLDLGPAILAGADVEILWRAMEGTRVERATNAIVLGPAYAGAPPVEPTEEGVRHAAGSLSDLRCEPGCHVFLVARRNGTLGMEGAGGFGMRALDAPREYAFFWDADRPTSYRHVAEAGWVGVSGGAGARDVARLRDATPRVSGDLLLVLFNVTGTLRVGDETSELSTRTSSEPWVVGGVEIGTRTTTSFVRAWLEDAAVAAPAGAAADLYAPDVAFSIDGSARALAAHGVVFVEGRRRDVVDEPVEATGTLRGRMSFQAAMPGILLDGSGSWRWTLRGEAESVRIGGRELVQAPPDASADGSSAVALGAVLALALAVLAKSGALSSLYTRFDRSSVLDNPNRRKVIEAIGASPAARVADVVRATGLREVVVRHHLHMLTVHGLVERHSVGGMRVYAPTAAGSPETLAAIAALRDPTRRRVAEAVVAAASTVTQREVAAATGISPRLVSHHLGKLARQGLVASEGALPRRYAPRSDLVALLRQED